MKHLRTCFIPLSMLKHTVILGMKGLQLSVTTGEHRRVSYSSNKLELADTHPLRLLILAHYSPVPLHSTE